MRIRLLAIPATIEPRARNATPGISFAMVVDQCGDMLDHPEAAQALTDFVQACGIRAHLITDETVDLPGDPVGPEQPEATTREAEVTTIREAEEAEARAHRAALEARSRTLRLREEHALAARLDKPRPRR